MFATLLCCSLSCVYCTAAQLLLGRLRFCCLSCISFFRLTPISPRWLRQFADLSLELRSNLWVFLQVSFRLFTTLSEWRVVERREVAALLTFVAQVWTQIKLVPRPRALYNT
jgi:hypothetical protein